MSENDTADGTATTAPFADEAVQPSGEKPITFKISDKVVVASDPSSPEAEAIAALRTHLLSHHVDRGRRGLAVCSPSGGSGTTFVSVNLAVSLARAGIKTLLIDANLREPSLHRMIVPSRDMPSLKDALIDSDTEYGSVIQENVLPNLSLIYSGGKSSHAQELLSGARFKTLLDLCMREFGVTIVDTPASNTNADGRRIASVVRHAIIVARKDWTYVADVNTLIDELRSDKVNVVGTVYNEY
ncbi:CpsD/CapB family tyrosine-protein kinase [Novosphingobium nitrogenifigens]|nr:CpsD/CapB family tyrosine-protein kinase [Novosphingobium nitrogenifigens]